MLSALGLVSGDVARHAAAHRRNRAAHGPLARGRRLITSAVRAPHADLVAIGVALGAVGRLAPAGSSAVCWCARALPDPVTSDRDDRSARGRRGRRMRDSRPPRGAARSARPRCGRSGTFARRSRQSLTSAHLTQVIRDVRGAAEEHREPVAQRILREILVGDGGVLARPVFGRELAEDRRSGCRAPRPTGASDPRLTAGPHPPRCDPSRPGTARRALDAGRADAEQRTHPVVNGHEVAIQIEQPVLPRRDFFLQLLVGERREEFLRAIELLLPREQRGRDNGCAA